MLLLLLFGHSEASGGKDVEVSSQEKAKDCRSGAVERERSPSVASS